MKFVILGLLIVLVIGFFVVVWKAARDWRWFQIVAAIFTMLLGVTFIFPTAGVLKSRSAWHDVKEKLEARAEAAVLEQKAIKYGDSSDSQSGEGLVALSQQLAQVGVEAGRVWRSLEMQTPNPQQVVLSKAREVVPPDALAADATADGAAADGEPAAALPLVPDGLVVYAFAEQLLPESQLSVPTFYLGEFRVDSSTPEQATLVPTMPLQPAQAQAISSRQAVRWSLYELLPLDGHLMFTAEGSLPNDENVYGRMDETALKQLFGNRIKPATLTKYLRDGGQAIQDDPPLSRWTMIEFTKKHKIEVDSPDKFGALDGGFFDAGGRAVDSRLQRSEDNEVSFNVGDRVVVKEEAASQLFDEGVAKLIKTYYLRPLNDYRFGIREIRLRLAQLAIRKEQVEFEKQVLEEAIAATESMLTTNQTVKLKLEQDLAHSQVETVAIKAYHDELAEELQQIRTTLISLFKSNQQLEQELTQMQMSIKNRIDAVTFVP
ncbi:hypothetical protein [Novipirellula artificiosorum]|uniref:Uncharacterized protein n=1 Tax=Novipirellula artificiosorum TaxID=2528016 RepID=A0A5C6DJB4_9BACT|nr:hypothetical protein [Novipirellula artificiosorum]TWU36194.1 hypothetical protein Poly41_39480 [Novipirellula artificiosorum]